MPAPHRYIQPPPRPATVLTTRRVLFPHKVVWTNQGFYKELPTAGKFCLLTDADVATLVQRNFLATQGVTRPRSIRALFEFEALTGNQIRALHQETGRTDLVRIMKRALEYLNITPPDRGDWR
ncbi:MAG: hypothetical protein RJB39_141 [Candidatus Parcubacteria bacterium]|jgi:hypothetical protein